MLTSRDYFCSMRAKDVMTRNVVTVYSGQEMSTAAQKLRDHRIAGVPVISREGRCVGILSTKDFLKLSPGKSGAGAVSTYMTSPAVTVSENHSLLDAAAILRSSRIHRVPVVDNQGRVVGILSTLDIVGQIFKAMEVETEATVC
ncbi:MAG: CBS domain-containing protein [Pirellulales bacterium]